MIRRILCAIAALCMAAPAIGQVDPAARGMAAQAGQMANAASAQASMLSRLRAASAAARTSNVIINPPLSPPAPWATGTAIFQGEVRSANGSWYVAMTSGTTASSGSGPASTAGAGISDGGVLWSYIGPPAITTADPAAPTVTQMTADPYTGITYTHAAFPNAYALYGAYVQYDGSQRLTPSGYYVTAGVRQFGPGRRISFYCDDAAPIIIASGGGTTWRIAIDNLDGRGSRLISPSGLSMAKPYIKIDSGSAKTRLYTIYLSPQAYDGFLGVEVGGQSQVWAPSRSGDLRAIVIGDSTVQGSGYGPWLAGGDVASRLAALTGIADVWSFSAGGTGEINPSAKNLYTFGQRIAEALALKPDIWIIMGSVNDRTYPASSITAAVQATMTAIRAGGSKAPIIRVGAWPIANDAAITTDEVAIKAGYDAFAATDPYPHAWVPWSTGSPPIITWPYNSPPAAPGGNNQRFLGGDGHPVDIGTAHEARRLAEATLSALVP
jgi:lysophospholipase L1-like esterase